MTVDEIRAAHRAEPFEPLRIRLADGRQFDVPSRICMGVDPTGRRLVVALAEDAFEIINLDSVREIQLMRPAQRRNARRAKPSVQASKKKKKPLSRGQSMTLEQLQMKRLALSLTKKGLRI